MEDNMVREIKASWRHINGGFTPIHTKEVNVRAWGLAVIQVNRTPPEVGIT
jgi:hypothetical protein